MSGSNSNSRGRSVSADFPLLLRVLLRKSRAALRHALGHSVEEVRRAYQRAGRYFAKRKSISLGSSVRCSRSPRTTDFAIHYIACNHFSNYSEVSFNRRNNYVDDNHSIIRSCY